MRCFFRLLRQEPSYSVGFAPKVFGGVFVFEGAYGETSWLEDIMCTHLDKKDILYINIVVNNLQDSFLHLILSEQGVRTYIEDLYGRIVFGPIKMIGFKVAIDMCGLLVKTNNQHKYLALYDNNILQDVYIRTLVMSVASGRELDDEYDMVRIVSLFCPNSELKIAEWLLNGEVGRSRAIHILEDLLAQVYLVRSIYDMQDNYRFICHNGINIDVLASEGERNSFDFALYIMKCRGFPYDKKKLIDIRTKILPKVLNADRKMVKAGFARSRTDSVTPTITLDDDAIDRCLLSRNVARRNKNGNILKKTYDFIQSGEEALMEYASISNERIISMVTIPNILDNTPSARSVIHPQYVSYSTTGRASCRSPNMTGVPVEGGVRECFHSREGYTLIIADYDSVEMRVFAQVLLDMVGTSQLAEMYQKNISFDPHSYLASKYLEISYDEALTRKAKDDKKFNSVRKIMKAVNFGFMGGASHETLAVRLQEDNGENLPIEQALKLKDFYFNTFPEIREYFSIIRKQIEEGSGSTDAYIHRSKRLIGKRNFTQALNNNVQALASDGALAALYEITRQGFNPWSALYKSRPLLSIHDELIIEVLDTHVLSAAKEILYYMEFCMNQRTPNVKSAVSVQQSKYWSKHAAEVTW